MLACMATVLGARYALDATLTLRDRKGGYESSANVIAADQKPEFLAYVRRQQAQSGSPAQANVGSETVLPILESDTSGSHSATGPHFIATR